MTLPASILTALGGAPLAELPLGPRSRRHVGPAASVVERRADSARKALQERRALELWAAYSGASPWLLGHEGLRLWMGSLPGRAGQADDPIEVYARLGLILAQVGAAPTGPDPLPLPDAIAARRAALLRGPAGPAVAGLLQRVQPLAFAGASRAHAHRDLAPRNWLVDHNNVYIIDLEHAGPDAPGADLARLGLELRCSLDPAPTRARVDALEAARLSAGGAPVHPAQLNAMLALTAAGTLSWGLRHDDAAFTERGRAWVAALQATHGPPW